MTKELSTDSKAQIIDIIILVLSMTCVYIIIWSFIGLEKNWYNSYVLQALAWLDGHLDLGRNYSHLEIAEYNNKFFVSFPPFPSVVYLPFALIWGEDLPEEFVMMVSAYLGGIYAYLTAKHFGTDGKKAIFWALFVTVCSNLSLLTVRAWVWFIAQNMSFTLAMMAIYYALKNKGGLSLFLWACCVGCRPFQVVMFPLLMWILYKNHPDMKVTDMIKRRWIWFVPMAAVAVFYMTLNYLRFGNIAEFGHKYLPEFVNLDTGMFNIKYIGQNLKGIFRFPNFKENFALDYPKFNGMNIFLSSPVFTAGVICPAIFFAKKYIHHEKIDNKTLYILIAVTIIAETFCIITKNNLGGLQFGCRYMVDVLPLTFLFIMLTKQKNSEYYFLPLFMLGIALNTVGTIVLFNDWF